MKRPRRILPRPIRAFGSWAAVTAISRCLEEDEICDEINLTQPDVIWVGLSVPLEYEFAVRNRDRLKAGWLVTCGGCFNYITGDYARAPRWMQAAGLEWLHRLWREAQKIVLALRRHQSACAFSCF